MLISCIKLLKIYSFALALLVRESEVNITRLWRLLSMCLEASMRNKISYFAFALVILSALFQSTTHSKDQQMSVPAQNGVLIYSGDLSNLSEFYESSVSALQHTPQISMLNGQTISEVCSDRQRRVELKSCSCRGHVVTV